MTKHSGRRSVRPTLEALEDRCTPTGTVTGSLANHVWTLTGEDLDNRIRVASTGSPGAFTVTATDPTPFPLTTLSGVTNPTGVKKIVFDMKGGNDDVTVSYAKLTSMVFLGGDGNNTFNADRLRLTNGLQVVNRVGSGILGDLGFDNVTLRNFKVGGNVNIDNGAGGSEISMVTTSAAAGFNNIAGNLTITNGAGRDQTTINDTNVGGNITANNGRAAGAIAGYFRLYNLQNGRRAVVGGTVSISFQDGTVDINAILDAVVRGNVLFNNGSGAAETRFDGLWNALPVVIEGRLKIAGSGANLVSIGRDYNRTGLRVGQNLIIDVKDPGELTLRASKLIVNGQTKII
jgi:hypothetical protein